MRLDVDRYLSKRFDLANYNCWHLVREAWLELTGLDLGDRTPEHITRAALCGRFAADVPTFQELAGPEEPAIVLMTRPGVVPHVGVLLGGRILQMGLSGASYLPLTTATLGFQSVRYYR